MVSTKVSICRQGQSGATLIEVLISVVVLSIGLLGVAGLQVSGLQGNFSAYQRSQASWIAYDLSDRMRVNRDAALAGGYDAGFLPNPPACNHNLNAVGTVAEVDLAEVRNAAACLLPQGDIRVERVAGVFAISVRWDDSRGAGADGTTTTFVFRMEL